MMYKNYSKLYLGVSDIASLTLRNANGVYTLNFGGDSSYSAYYVTDDIAIPEYYSIVFEHKGWLWIYDDNGKTVNIEGDIVIYRAGDYGCIIKVLNEVKR